MEENDIKTPNSSTNTNRKKVAILIFVVVVIAIVIIAVTVSTNSKSEEKLTISNTNMTVTYNEYLGYMVTITGVAKNTSDQNLSYASVGFSVYDVSGNNLGTALANINNLMKGDTWMFEAFLFDSPSTQPATYRLTEVIAYSI